jgi:hypothetical protein
MKSITVLYRQWMGMIADGVANKLPYVDPRGLWGSVMCETIFKDI